MRRALFGACISVLIVAGCGTSAATSNPVSQGTPAAVATPAAPATPAASDQAAGPSVAAQQSTSQAGAAVDPCTLITQAEAAAALGGPVDPGKQAAAGASSCLWSGNDPSKPISADGVDVSVTSVSTFDKSHKAGAGITVTPVPGLGDEAYFVDLGIGYMNLRVKKGSTAFTVTVMLSGASNDKLQAADKSLAQLIVGRI
jgi:uncharacterized protein YidB (DUF937 family)